MTLISIIVPVYNEEKTIIPILEKVNSQNVNGLEFEIIVVDDGSTDKSFKLLEEHSKLYTKLIHSKKNSGKGSAVKIGLKNATGDFIMFQDADLEYEPQDYEKLLLPIKKLNADVVMGSRINAPPLTRVHYYWHKKGNEFITFLFNFLNNTTFSDIYSGYLIFRRSLLDPEKLRTLGWEQQAEILSKIVRKSNGIFEVPIIYYGRTYEEGKKIKPSNGIKIISTIIRERFFSSN